MINAKYEFETFISQRRVSVKCATITMYGHHVLPIGYSLNDWILFLEGLDFNYNNEYGILNLSGNIWFADGSWADRYHNDEDEGWVWHVYPTIPEYLTIKQ